MKSFFENTSIFFFKIVSLTNDHHVKHLASWSWVSFNALTSIQMQCSKTFAFELNIFYFFNKTIFARVDLSKIFLLEVFLILNISNLVKRYRIGLCRIRHITYYFLLSFCLVIIPIWNNSPSFKRKIFKDCLVKMKLILIIRRVI